jgi:hypothetical protein
VMTKAGTRTNLPIPQHKELSMVLPIGTRPFCRGARYTVSSCTTCASRSRLHERQEKGKNVEKNCT